MEWEFERTTNHKVLVRMVGDHNGAFRRTGKRDPPQDPRYPQYETDHQHRQKDWPFPKELNATLSQALQAFLHLLYREPNQPSFWRNFDVSFAAIAWASSFGWRSRLGCTYQSLSA